MIGQLSVGIGDGNVQWNYKICGVIDNVLGGSLWQVCSRHVLSQKLQQSFQPLVLHSNL